MLRFLRTSAPIGGQWLLDMTTFAIFASVVARMGDVSMAASQAMLQLLSVSFMQAFAISIAAGTLVGRYIGGRDLEAAQRSYGSAQMLALGLALLVAILFVGVPEALLGIFSRDANVLELARPLLLLGAFFQVIDAVGIVASGSLRGAGDTRWPFAVQATLAWALRLPAVYVAAIWLEGGVFGAWVGELVYVLVLSLALVLRFRAGHWRTIRI
jgi:Na+-driven multidrug efflux pump